MCTGDPSSILSGIASIAGIINKVKDVNQTVQEQEDGRYPHARQQHCHGNHTRTGQPAHDQFHLS